MKKIEKLVLGVILILVSHNCTNKKDINPNNAIKGTWKMVYAEVKENDSLKIKDLTHTSFIKIINDTHFAFFNQENNSVNNFYGGGGKYILKGNNYTEVLNYIGIETLKNHEFPFTIRIKGDTLIQKGIEEVKEAGINREILEKYVRIR
ncbi:hypothetical protein [Wocania ichthyoenteri]|uniref:hypothetical protein n=1 Tax=Wocania ichthyoenteri TaxID=1230531 RepID=UPI00053E92B8|nr:hypothetical protein [Wocania ichthyoenteri]